MTVINPAIGGLAASPPAASLVRVTVAQPAAGADWSYTIPAGVWARLLTGLVTLTTSSTAGNRNPGLKISDGTPTVIGQLESTVNVPASSVVPVAYSRGAAFTTAGQTATGLWIGLPGLILPPGYSIASITAGLLSGDQYSQIQLLLEEWTSQPAFDTLAPSQS